MIIAGRSLYQHFIKNNYDVLDQRWLQTTLGYYYNLLHTILLIILRLIWIVLDEWMNKYINKYSLN